MKTITVTSQLADNYGAVLQSYALQQTMLSLGYDNELLNIKAEQSNLPIKIKLRNTALKCVEKIHFIRSKKLSQRFTSFRKNYLRQTREYRSICELRKDPPKADIYLTGSDQVFAVGNSLVPVRFLDFGAEETVRVSYAASKGTYEYDEKTIGFLYDMLSKFSKISMREEQGTDYIRNTLHLESQTHIDPVFLLSADRWSEITSGYKIKGKYILCYRMLQHDAFAPLLQQLKEKMGYQIVSIQPRSSNKIRADIYLYDVTPEDFVQLIRDAEVVVTSSFHATAFSIIFQKKFYTLVNYKPERAINLCKLFGLENRVITKDFTTFAAVDDIDYGMVDQIISQERAHALKYLDGLKTLVPQNHNCVL